MHYATRSNSPSTLGYALKLIDSSDRIEASQLITDEQAKVALDLLKQGNTRVTRIEGSRSPAVSEETFQALQNTLQKFSEGKNVGYDPKRNFFPITGKENVPGYNGQDIVHGL